MWYPLLAVLMFLAVIVPSPCAAQDNSPPASEQHRWLQERVGRWEARISVFIPGSDEPLKTVGTETIRSLGPYWTITDLQFKFGDAVLSSHGTLGFDVGKKKYVGTWLESSSPYPAEMEGEITQQADSIPLLMKGKTPDGQPDEYRIVLLRTDKDHRVVKIQRPDDQNPDDENGKWRTEVLIEYTRDSAIPPPTPAP